MGLIQILIILVVVAIFVGIIYRFIPDTVVSPKFKNIISTVAVVVVLLWLLFGVFDIMRYDIPVTKP